MSLWSPDDCPDTAKLVPYVRHIEMMSTSDCLAHATDMDSHAARCAGSARAPYLRLAIVWRRVARMAEYQDEWVIRNELAAKSVISRPS